jgi:hypothetical protein
LLLPLSSSSCHGFGGFICWVWFLFSHHAFLSVVVSGSLLWLHRFSFSMVFSGSSDGLFPYIQLLFVFGSVRSCSHILWLFSNLSRFASFQVSCLPQTHRCRCLISVSILLILDRWWYPHHLSWMLDYMARKCLGCLLCDFAGNYWYVNDLINN